MKAEPLWDERPWIGKFKPGPVRRLMCVLFSRVARAPTDSTHQRQVVHTEDKQKIGAETWASGATVRQRPASVIQFEVSEGRLDVGSLRVLRLLMAASAYQRWTSQTPASSETRPIRLLRKSRPILSCFL